MKRQNRWIAAVLLVILAGAGAIAQLIQRSQHVDEEKSIGVFDVQVDHAHRRWADIVFDHPVEVALAGRVIAPAPGEIDPATDGVWRWRSNNVLRFEPAGGFMIGRTYHISLHPKRLVAAGERFRGNPSVDVRIDKLMVDNVTVTEEPAGEDRHAVLLRGEAHFNYDVTPELLLDKIWLIDGSARQAAEIESTGYSSAISFRTKPLLKTKSERKVVLLIEKGVAEKDTGIKLESDYSQEITLGSIDKLAVREAKGLSSDTDSTMRVELSSEVNPEIAAKFVTVKPAVKYRLSSEGNYLVLSGGFTPGTEYELDLAKGLPALDDAMLDRDYSTTVTFPDLERSLDFQSEGMFLSASGYRNIAVKSVNVDEAVLSVDRVYRNNIFWALTGYGYYDSYNDDAGEYDDEDEVEEGDRPQRSVNHALGDRLTFKHLKIRPSHNKKVVTSVALDPFIRKGEPGLYRVWLQGRNLSQQSRWVLITDLGIVAKQGSDELLVWVSSFKDLASIEDATVTLVSDQNQTIATGRTDARGLWRAKLPAKKKPYLITVQKGKDYSFLLFNRTAIDTSPFDVAGDRIGKDGYSAFLYGERDLYRPGETVQGIALVRDRALQAPPEMPLVVKHYDGNDERETFRITAGDGGIAPFSLKLPAYARTGHHRFDVIAGKEVVGTYGFQVEEFVPDRIKVEIRPKTTDASPGHDLEYDVSSAYLFGPPAANLPVESRVRIEAAEFSPKGFSDYRFGNEERKFDGKEIANGEDHLDPAGVKGFTAAIPAGLQVPSSLQAVITARVREEGGRGVAAIAYVPVHPYPYYIGLKRRGSAWAEVNKSTTFDWVAVGKDGKTAKGGVLRAELMEDEWHCMLRQSGNGYDYQSVRESRQISVKTIEGGQERGTFTFTPSRYGDYRVVVTDPATGASSELEFYATGWGYSPWAIKNPGRLQLELDKEEYQPGDDAVVQVKAPFSGKLLITLERDNVQYTAIETITGNTATIHLPISAELRPNAYVTATLVRAAKDLEPGEAGRAFGAIPISVDRTSNRIAPSIKVVSDLRSRKKLPVEVTAEPGATVTIAAVDEGILQLIAQRTADPFSYFYRKLALGESTYDIYSSLLPEVKPKGKAAAGGSENMQGLAQYVRADGMRRAKPVAFWSGVLKAGADGKARTSFDIPDFQGGVRVMAVVARGRRFGDAEAMVRVHDPIVIMPTVPRFLSVRDQVSIPVTVRNDTGRNGKFVVEALGSVQRVEVANAREATVLLPLQAPPQPGTIPFNITVTGNDEKATTSAEIPVRWDIPAESVEDVGSVTEPAMHLKQETMKQFVPGSVERTLVVSPLPLVQFRGKLSYLLHYPYGCVEQTTSSVFPLIYFSDLAKTLDPDAFANNDSAYFVHEGIRRLGTMQTYNGSFAMWPYGTTTHPWGTAYATHFLVEARRAGHQVDSSIYDRALAYIAQDAKAKSDYDSQQLERIVYELYILARAGKPDLGTMGFIREHQLSELQSQSKALLAAAFASVGNPTPIAELLASLDDAEARTEGMNFDSIIRNRALLLLAILDASPNDPRIPRLFERLTRDATANPWWSTQECGFTLVAVGQFMRQQHEKPAYSGAVFLDNKMLGTFTGKTATFAHIKGDGVLRVKMNAPYTKGAAFFSLSTRGIKTAQAFKPESDGIRITRELLTRDGKPVDPAGVQQGDLLVCVTKVRSTAGTLDNVVVENLIPAGLEVENPRLESTESLPWVSQFSECTNVDIRDDQVLFFVELPASGELTFYTLLRAVTPGVYQYPPVLSEAMYARQHHVVGERGTLVVRAR